MGVLEARLCELDSSEKRKYYAKLEVLKQGLLSGEYIFTLTNFQGGNDHGPLHIERVLEYLDKLIPPDTLSTMSYYELFVLLCSAVYHDIGLLRGRLDHSTSSMDMISLDINNYITTPEDVKLIGLLVECHSSKKKIEEVLRDYEDVESIAGYSIRPKFLAMLLRMADELDEDCRRAQARIYTKLELSEESQAFWRGNQCIKSIVPQPSEENIAVRVEFTEDDLERRFTVKGENVNSVQMVVRKLKKINDERKYCMRFAMSGTSYKRISCRLFTPLGRYELVLDDFYSGEDFFHRFPELLQEKETRIERAKGSDEKLRSLLRFAQERGLALTGEGLEDDLMKELFEMGIVEFKVRAPRVAVLENDLTSKFELHDAVVVMVGSKDEAQIRSSLGIAAASYFEGIVKEGSLVGLACGRTLYEMVKALEPRRYKSLRVVPLSLSVGGTDLSVISVSVILKTICDKYGTGAIGYDLQIPAFLSGRDSREIDDQRKMLLSRPDVRTTWEAAHNVDIAVFSIGGLGPGSTIGRASSYLAALGIDAQPKAIENLGAVGEVNYFVFDSAGKMLDCEINRRILAISPEFLCQITQEPRKRTLAIAGGESKHAAILGALKGKLFDTLVTDELTAEYLLKTSALTSL